MKPQTKVEPLRSLNHPRFRYTPASATTADHLRRTFRKARLMLRLNPNAYETSKQLEPA